MPSHYKGLLHTLYRTLDYLADSKQEIEKEIYYGLQCHDLETEFVLYDMTSSYFEGDDAELAEYGYSRDYRLDRPQIVIGVVTSKEDIPFVYIKKESYQRGLIIRITTWRVGLGYYPRFDPGYGDRLQLRGWLCECNEAVTISAKIHNIKNQVFNGDWANDKKNDQHHSESF